MPAVGWPAAEAFSLLQAILNDVCRADEAWVVLFQVLHGTKQDIKQYNNKMEQNKIYSTIIK